MKVMTPYQRAKEVNKCRMLSLYVQSGIGSGKIPYSLFNEKLTIKVEDNKYLTLTPESFTEEDIKGIADNLRILTIGSCFVAFDEAFDDLLGAKPAQYSDNDMDSLRAIVYMVRCAFAHNPASPVWEIHAKHRKIFKVKGIGFEIDLSTLNGKAVDFPQFGGLYKMFQLITHSMTVIEKLSA